MKKKNLLKCLALTSMLALSVGAVTSCGTAQQGAQGPQGETGSTGAQGEKGEAGEDGKTYLEVIVVPGVVSGGTIEQDKYYVQAGESFTLTFKDADGKTPEVVFDFTINGTVISVDPGSASYTYTATAADTGFQITSATFGTVKDYAKVQIYAEVYKLWGNDKQIAITEDETHTNADGFVESDYYEDSKSISEAALTAISDASDAIDDLDKDATVAEKVAAAKTEIDKGIKAVDAEYASVIAAAKTKAGKALDTLDKSFDAVDAFETTDRTSILATAKKAVTDATTLEGIASVVSAAKNTDGDFIDVYNKLYDQKHTAFDAISGALEKITDTAFADTDAGEEELDAIKTQLATYGVSVDKLPSEVATEWNKKISAATSFEVYTADASDDSTDTYSKGDLKVAYEGAKAVRESYTGLKKSLKEAIIQSYYKEINESKVLSADAMTTLRGVINGAVSDWSRDHDSNSLKANLKDYFGAEFVQVDTILVDLSDSGTGLIGGIEQRLSNSTSVDYMAFAAERLSNAVSAAYKQATSEVAEVKKDSVYAAIFGTKMTKSSVDAEDTNNTYAKGDYVVPGYIGTKDTNGIDARIKNPFMDDLTGLIEYKDSKGKGTGKYIVTAAAYDGKFASATVTGVATGVSTLGTSGTITPTKFDCEHLLQQIFAFKADGSLNTTNPTTAYLNGLTSVKDIKSASNKLVGIFKSVYKAALAAYDTAELTDLKGTAAGQEFHVTTETTDPSGAFVTKDVTYDYLTSELVETLYKGMAYSEGKLAENTTLSSISGYAYSLISNGAKLKLLDVDLQAWALKNVGDTKLIDSGKIADTNGVYAAALDSSVDTSIVSKILSGSLDTEAKIQKAVDGLDDIYVSDVAAYGENTLESFKEYYNAAIKGQVASVVAGYKLAYNNVLKTWKYDVTASNYAGSLKNVNMVSRSQILGNTYISCDNWLDAAKKYLDAANTTWNPTTELEKLLQLELVDKGVIERDETTLASAQNEFVSSLVVKTKPTTTKYAVSADVVLTGLVLTLTKGDGVTTADTTYDDADYEIVKDGTVIGSDGKVKAAGNVQIIYKGIITFTVAITIA